MHKLILAACLVCSPAMASPTFILLQDLPYTDTQEYVYKNIIRPAILNSNADFVIHGGDMQGSKAICSRDGLKMLRDDLYSLMPERVFLTPGDNDWTDCDRPSNSKPVSEYKALSWLRELFYSPGPAGKPEWQLARQEGFPENARWLVDNSLFVTLHILGTVNGRQQVYLDAPDYALEQVEARDSANYSWLQDALTFASEHGASHLVVAAHADITVGEGKPACTRSQTRDCDPYQVYRQQLREAATEFGKPMLFIHGDTEPFCLDKGYGGTKAPNLWRLNGAGDYNLIDALRVDVRDSETEPFSIKALTGDAVPSKC